SEAPARRRVTVRSSGLQVLEELEQEGAVLKFGVGDVQADFVDGAAVVGQDVDVDLPRAPTLAGGAAKLLLEVFYRIQQRARLERGLDLEHLVQEAGLVTDANRIRLGHARALHHRNPRLGQRGARRRQVSGAVAEG